jgi:hypothetical protein
VVRIAVAVFILAAEGPGHGDDASAAEALLEVCRVDPPAVHDFGVRSCPGEIEDADGESVGVYQTLTVGIEADVIQKSGFGSGIASN